MFNNSLWLKIYHHNATTGDFFTKNEALRVNKANKFSILYKINDNFKLKRDNTSYYSFMLEYPQIPQYGVWHQTSSIFQAGNASEGYEFQYGNLSTYRFHGLHTILPTSIAYGKSLLTGDSNGVNWYIAIGVYSHDYHNFDPGPVDDANIVQFVDLWIEVGGVNKYNIIKTFICSANQICYVAKFKKFFYVFTFMEE